MKKKLVCILLVLLLGAAGCGDSKEKRENQEAYRQIGINCMAEGDYEGAVEAFQKALDQSLAKIGEMELDTCYYKAEAQYLAGKTKDAIETYNALLEYDDKDAKAYYLRGSLYLAEGQKEDALKDFEAAVKNGRGDLGLYVEISEQLAAHDEKETADTYLEEALKNDGKSAESYTWRGRIYLMQGDYENARKELEQASDKGDPDVSLYLGELYEAMGESDKAEGFFKSYVEDHTGDTQALESLADLAIGKEDYAKAASYLELALETEAPANAQSLRRKLIQAYENSGNFTSAKEQMESYVKDYPEDEEAVRENSFLQTR